MTKHPSPDSGHDGDHCTHGAFHLVGLNAEAPVLTMGGRVVLNDRPAWHYRSFFPSRLRAPTTSELITIVVGRHLPQ